MRFINLSHDKNVLMLLNHKQKKNGYLIIKNGITTIIKLKYNKLMRYRFFVVSAWTLKIASITLLILEHQIRIDIENFWISE